jgi:hypothetical protein
MLGDYFPVSLGVNLKWGWMALSECAKNMDQRWNEENWEKSVSIEMILVLQYGTLHVKNPNTLPADSQPCEPVIMAPGRCHKCGTRAR